MLFAGLFGSALMGIFTIAFALRICCAISLRKEPFRRHSSPSFLRRSKREWERSAWVLASKMMTLAAIFMSIVSLLGVVFARQLIDILAPGSRRRMRD